MLFLINRSSDFFIADKKPFCKVECLTIIHYSSFDPLFLSNSYPRLGTIFQVSIDSLEGR
jgi:hypothetical protein